MFAFLSRILGSNNTNIAAYSLHLNPFGAFFCQSWLNVTGNSDGPTYFFWGGLSKQEGQTSWWPNLMIFLCWAVWIANSYSMNLMMLNILIAIVFESFDTCMNSSINRKYSQRCEMNRECRLILEKFGLNPYREVFILSAMTEHDDDKWNGFVKTVTDYIKNEVDHTKDLIKQSKQEVKETIKEAHTSLASRFQSFETRVADKTSREIKGVKKEIVTVQHDVDQHFRNVQDDLNAMT